MRTLTAFFLLFSISDPLLAQDGSSRELVIRDVTVISPERAAPLEHGYIRIRDGSIVDVSAEPLMADQAIEASGLYLIPGLIDGHVHLADILGQPPPDLIPAYEAQLPRSYLYFGYTTLIDLHVVDRPFLERLVGSPLHPDVYDCDAALVLANGYPMVFAPPEQRFRDIRNFLYDARQADAIPDELSPENYSPAANVARVAEADGICVKVHWEDGFGTNTSWPTPTPELIEQVVSESHARGLTVAIHANSYEAQRFAVDVGVDLIAHGMWNWDGLQAAIGLPMPIEQVLDTVIQERIGYMPTIQVITGQSLMFDPEFLSQPSVEAVLPAQLIDWYRTEDGRWFAEERRAESRDADDAALRERFSGAAEPAKIAVRYLADGNANFVFGSDTPSGPIYGNPPGYNGYLEMQQLIEAGMSLHQLFSAATVSAARAFGLDDRYGTIESGKLANLLLLRRNPLEDVSAYDTIETVILRGRAIDRDVLSASRN
jgi:imidazolonepropionase-like amidohydrolase